MQILSTNLKDNNFGGRQLRTKATSEHGISGGQQIGNFSNILLQLKSTKEDSNFGGQQIGNFSQIVAITSAKMTSSLTPWLSGDNGTL